MAFFEEACIPMGCRKVFTDRRVFMFSNTLMRVSSCQADVIWKTMIHRAYALSSMTEAFDQECTRLRSIFTRPDYPLEGLILPLPKPFRAFHLAWERKTRKTAALWEWVCPSKMKHQLSQLKGKCVISVKIVTTLQPVFISAKL